ncbi:MAG: SRPBCC family protein [Sphingobacteriales bacterium]|nr:MAG: SRPBCC family protein [Sphingobacteriales bacterium]
MNIEINKDAPVKCSKTITINSSVEKVWSILTNIDNWGTWQTDITNPKLNGVLKPGTTFNWKTGGVKILSTIHTVKPNSLFGWTGKAFGTFAIHNFELSRKDDLTSVTVQESMEGFLVKLFKNSFKNNLEKGMNSWLDLLKKECEKQND